MIKICLDTNSLHDNWMAGSEAFTLLADLIAKGRCQAYISEISIREHVRHYEREAPQIESRLKTQIGNYAKIMGFKPQPVPSLHDPAKFEKHFRKRLNELGIMALAIVPVPHTDLVTRDLAERKPFDSEGKGYRDALIWLSFLEVLDETTTRAVLVSNNIRDFCDQSKSKLHPALRSEVISKSPKCENLWFPTPQKLADDLIKPCLQVLAQENAKAEKILKRIQQRKYRGFDIENVVIEGLQNFESQEAEGVFFAGDAPLEEPLWVTTVETPSEIEATALYTLQGGNYLCEGTAEVTATVEGYLDKFEAFNQSEEGYAYISTPDWNEHYSEVEVPNLPARITFSFEFQDGNPDVLRFGVSKVESLD